MTEGETPVPYHAGPLRLLNAEERAARQAYIDAHPGVDELELAPTTAGYAPVADWLASQAPPEAPESAGAGNDTSVVLPAPEPPAWPLPAGEST
jgi:hypothetical protein